MRSCSCPVIAAFASHPIKTWKFVLSWLPEDHAPLKNLSGIKLGESGPQKLFCPLVKRLPHILGWRGYFVKSKDNAISSLAAGRLSKPNV
jgi:hypothetical protein